MSLELKLLPMRCCENFSHEVLIVRDFDSISSIGALPSLDVPSGFHSYLSRNDDCEASHYGETVATPYGERLTYTLAKHLKKISIGGPEGAFISALDDQVKVALYWC